MAYMGIQQPGVNFQGVGPGIGASPIQDQGGEDEIIRQFMAALNSGESGAPAQGAMAPPAGTAALAPQLQTGSSAMRPYSSNPSVNALLNKVIKPEPGSTYLQYSKNPSVNYLVNSLVKPKAAGAVAGAASGGALEAAGGKAGLWSGLLKDG